jgi:hypothetical protein
MDSSDVIICEYEQLIKIKEFHRDNEWDAYRWTYQRVIKDIEREYMGSIKEKLNRWVSITNARHFKNAPGVLFYFLAKMLFRDGYYEAGIAVARSICEMVCYDFLTKESHPFGTNEEIEQTLFGVLSKFLAIPKKIPKADFKKQISDKIQDIKARNFIKSSYHLEHGHYSFKVENGKDGRNLKRIHAILDEVGYRKKGIFPDDTFKLVQSVYDKGSDYIHARKSGKPKDDAMACINSIGKILAHLYNVEGNEMIGKTMITGYNVFPDVSQSGSFWMDAYLSPEEAHRGYYNAPSIDQFKKMATLSGEWKGEWRKSANENETGTLHFYSDGECLQSTMKMESSGTIYDKIDIFLFGKYFHLMIHDKTNDGSKGSCFMKFELEIFNSSTLIGEVLGNGNKAYFTKINLP